MIEIEKLAWEKAGGLLPAIVQDSDTGRALMLGYMNREALERTLETGFVTFWSRSRQCLWTKGETSGHRLSFAEIRTDCDSDALLVLAHPAGPTCHRGTRSCFSPDDKFSALEFLAELEQLILERKATRPKGSYTTQLFQKGDHEISKKVGEEAIELVLSRYEGKQRTIEEAADLIYHTLVLLAERGVSLSEVTKELESRHK